VRALRAAEVYKKHVAGVRKSMLRLVANVGGSPAEILLGAADQNGRVEVLTIPFSTRAIEEQARANEAAAAIETPTRATNLIRMPSPKPVVDKASPEWRRAEFLRLSHLSEESWSHEEADWMKGYAVLGDYIYGYQAAKA
jgi:hypothetical protein